MRLTRSNVVLANFRSGWEGNRWAAWVTDPAATDAEKAEWRRSEDLKQLELWVNNNYARLDRMVEDGKLDTPKATELVFALKVMLRMWALAKYDYYS